MRATAQRPARRRCLPVFEAFYGMTRTPFPRDLSPDALYHSPAVDEVLSRLHYAAEQQWFVVVTGDCGVGKSTVLRHFRRQLDPTAYTLLYVADSKLTPRTFYPVLLEQLGYEPHRPGNAAKRQLHRELAVLYGLHHRRAILVVDEAHLLSRTMVEELRFVVNTQMDGQSPLTLVLVGQSDLWDRLRLQAYTAIRQRINLQCRLSAWDRAEVGAYIQHQLRVAGVDHALFSDAALDVIYQFSGGVARMINQVCTQSLLYGAQQGHRVLDDRIITQVIQGELS